MTENQPNINADAPANSTAKKFLVFNSRNTANTQRTATIRRMIAVTMSAPPIELFFIIIPD